MHPQEVFHFSDNNYCRKIQHPEFTYAQLTRGIYTKPCNIATSRITVYTSTIAAPVTHGMSFLATATALRNINIKKRKLCLLEEEWQMCGQTQLPRRFIEDTLIPVILATAIGALIFTIDIGISSIAVNTVYNAQMGIPSMEFHGHVVGAVCTVIEQGLAMAAQRFNEQLVGSSGSHRR